MSGAFRYLFGSRVLARVMQNSDFMEFCCRHCDEISTGAMYRVFSEEDGVTLLDMIVCRSCYDQARELGLDCEEVNPDESCLEQLPSGPPLSRVRAMISRSFRSFSSLVFS
jgi:hypothetical protein